MLCVCVWAWGDGPRRECSKLTGERAVVCKNTSVCFVCVCDLRAGDVGRWVEEGVLQVDG